MTFNNEEMSAILFQLKESLSEINHKFDLQKQQNDIQHEEMTHTITNMAEDMRKIEKKLEEETMTEERYQMLSEKKITAVIEKSFQKVDEMYVTPEEVVSIMNDQKANKLNTNQMIITIAVGIIAIISAIASLKGILK